MQFHYIQEKAGQSAADTSTIRGTNSSKFKKASAQSQPMMTRLNPKEFFIFHNFAVMNYIYV